MAQPLTIARSGDFTCSLSCLLLPFSIFLTFPISTGDFKAWISFSSTRLMYLCFLSVLLALTECRPFLQEVTLPSSFLPFGVSF
jgi:hypothetical protein